jgi:hypothetical protein
VNIFRNSSGGAEMKLNTLRLMVISVGLFFAVSTMLGHHSFMPSFNMKAQFTLQGIVTKVDFANPHITFYMDVTGQDGKVTNWALEGAAPAALIRRGWTRDSMKPGDTVTVRGYVARDGSPVAAIATVTLPDGRRIFGGSDGVQP